MEEKKEYRECVFVESPYSGDIDRNVRYLKFCKYDCWARGEMPCSSHDDMTQHPAKKDFYVSDYDEQWTIYGRDGAIEGAHSLRALCAKTVFYTDRGISTGMKAGIEYCKQHNIPYEMRTLNIDNVLSYGNKLMPRRFVEAVVNGEPYQEYFTGTPLLE